MDGFDRWLQQRNPWALGRPWHRILSFQNLWMPERAFTAFWTHFDLFRNGEPPDAMTPVAKQLFDQNSGLADMSDDERKSWQENLNRIFYTE